VVCYRRYGHNEGDEPYYTQPEMYERIKDRPPLYRIYAQGLEESGTLGEEDLSRIVDDINKGMERGYSAVHEKTCRIPEDRFYNVWEGITGRYSDESVETGTDGNRLVDLARKLNNFPEGFSVHPRLIRILNRRLQTVEKGSGIDWATAEALAFASLLVEGTPIRLSGEDSSRGTFSHRHSVLSDVKTGEHYVPLNNLTQDQAIFHVYDSMLSENAVLGFEHGYSLVSPETLVIWEAQFGDFANNAQPVFDQFVSSAEFKWRRLSGLTALLPHGLEGQGPEHSSARVERFLQLCAEDNMQVCYPSTPAQYFHMLRRQMKRKFRKPLIVLTPKSLLRNPAAVSNLSDLAAGHFQDVLGDPDAATPSRVLLCSGKIYYELTEARKAAGDSDTAILRIEQFYPFPEALLKDVLSGYPSSAVFHWVQEEPENMGGWDFMRWRLMALTGADPGYIGRPAAASPASGYLASYKREQKLILKTAFPAKSGNDQEKV
jgi:2-oxoglutarate dehydrogenase E1 component